MFWIKLKAGNILVEQSSFLETCVMFSNMNWILTLKKSFFFPVNEHVQIHFSYLEAECDKKNQS